VLNPPKQVAPRARPKTLWAIVRGIMLSNRLVPTVASAAVPVTTAPTMLSPKHAPSPLTTVVQSGVTEEMLYNMQEMLLQRITALEELFNGRVGQAEGQMAKLWEASNSHDQALVELSAGQGRLEASSQQKFSQTTQSTAAVAANLEELTAQLVRADGQQQDMIQSLEASVAQLQQAVALCAKEAETRIRFEGAAKDLRQCRADAEQDIRGVREALARTEVAIRGLVAESDAKHCRAHEDLRAALHRVELEATQTRSELMARDDVITKELERAEAALRGLLTEVSTAHSRAEEELRAGQHRADLQAAQTREELTSRDEALSKTVERAEAALRGLVAEVTATHSRAEEELRAGLHRVELQAAQVREELMGRDDTILSSLERTEVALRGLLAEANAAHSRVEDELRAALHRAELQAAQTREELTNRDGALSTGLERTEAALRGLVSEVDAKHCRAEEDLREAAHRAELEAAQSRAELMSRDDALGTALDRTEVALRGVIAEVNASRSRAEEELRALLHRAEVQTAQAREELVSSYDGLSAELRGVASRLEAQLDRLEAQRRGDLEDAKRQHSELEKRLAGVSDELDRGIQAANGRVSALDAGVHQLRADLQHDFGAVRETMNRADAALRSLMSETDAKHGRAEEDLRAALHRAELQAAQTREELMGRGDALSAALDRAEVALRGLVAETSALHARAEEELRGSLHRADLQAAQSREELMAKDDAISASLDRAEAGLRGLLSEASAGHARAEEELRAALLRAELEAAQGRKELAARDEALSAELRELAARQDLQVDRIEGQRRSDLHEAKRQLQDLERRTGSLVEGLERSLHATNSRVAAVDSDQTSARLRAVTELSAKSEALGHEVAKSTGEVAHVRGAMADTTASVRGAMAETTASVRGAMLDTTLSARRQGERLEHLEGSVAAERECRLGFEQRLAAESAALTTAALSPAGKLRSRLDSWRDGRSSLPPVRSSSLERPSYLSAVETMLL